MNSLLVALVGFLATIALIIVLRPIAIAVGLTDLPDERKRHSGSVPLVGGIAIFLGFAIAVFTSPWLTEVPAPLSPRLRIFMFCAALLVLAGCWDDYRGLTPLTRIVVQIFVAMIMVSGAGLVIIELGSHPKP